MNIQRHITYLYVTALGNDGDVASTARTAVGGIVLTSQFTPPILPGLKNLYFRGIHHVAAALGFALSGGFAVFVCKVFQAHDRFLIIDNKTYHLGASIKDLGKKIFAFSLMEEDASELLIRLEE